MSSSSSGSKPTLCRYFVKQGSCFYGKECQFLHALTAENVSTDDINNQLKNTSLHELDGNGAVTTENESMTSYDSNQINGLPSESKLHMFLSVQRSMSSNVPVSPNEKAKLSSSLHASYSTLNPESSTNNTPTSISNDFFPQSTMAIDNTLTHSSSSPSFLMSNSAATTSNKVAYSRYNNLSPNGSPRVTPSHSPLIDRREKSPVPDNAEDNVAQPLYQAFENVGGTTYFYTHDSTLPTQNKNVMNQDSGIVSGVNNLITPEFNVFHAAPAHIHNIQQKANGPNCHLPDELRMELLHRNSLTLSQVDPKQYPDLPTEVDNYHNLCPIEPIGNNQVTKSSTFGYVTSVYKATNMKTGVCYCLRRIHGYRLVSTKCMNLAEMWKNLQHSNLVQLREVFTTKAFGGEHSIVFVHDYHPGASTMMNHFFSQSQTNNSFSRGGSVYGPEGAPRPYSQSNKRLLPESQIWAFIVQLSSVLRTIHAAGLACRTLEPTKILVTGKSRLRVNCCGIFDIISYDHNQPPPISLTQHYQQEDLLSLGRIVVAIACNSVSSVQRDNIQSSIDLVTRNYSSDLRNLIHCLLGNRIRSVNDIMPMIGARFYTQLDHAQIRNDIIENELAKEVESARLYRLITKICMICERPEFNMDHTWAETGDRYMLKLFRDYVFHLVTEDGTPWLDLAHVIHCMNKLDSGVEEKICLSSRDEQNVLVVSYAELKRCFEASFTELLSSTVQTMKPS